jgi:hypothetical protein
MKRTPLVAAVLAMALWPAWGQQSPHPSAPAPDRSKNGAQQDVLQSEQFSDAVASALLSRIAEGFTRRNPKLFLSAFDAQQFPGYGLFSDRVRARLGQSAQFRTYFRIVNRVVQDPPAVDVELQIEQSSTTPGVPPTRNTGHAHFTFGRGAAGWKIVDVVPRELLTGVRGPA